MGLSEEERWKQICFHALDLRWTRFWIAAATYLNCERTEENRTRRESEREGPE